MLEQNMVAYQVAWNCITVSAVELNLESKVKGVRWTQFFKLIYLLLGSENQLTRLLGTALKVSAVGLKLHHPIHISSSWIEIKLVTEKQVALKCRTSSSVVGWVGSYLLSSHSCWGSRKTKGMGNPPGLPHRLYTPRFVLKPRFTVISLRTSRISLLNHWL